MIISEGGDEIKSGYVDRNGKSVIKPKFDWGFEFSEGMAGVRMGDLKSRKWGFIDKTGNMIIEPRFDKVRLFIGGISQIEINGKMGYINKNGKYIWEPTN